MEPPKKRARTAYARADPFALVDIDEDEISMDPDEFAVKQDPNYLFDMSRAAADNKLKSVFESLFEKYGKDFGDTGDEINFYTDEIEVDNGHIASLPNAHTETAGALLSDKDTDGSDEEERQAEGKRKAPNIGRPHRTPSANRTGLWSWPPGLGPRSPPEPPVPVDPAWAVPDLADDAFSPLRSRERRGLHCKPLRKLPGRLGMTGPKPRGTGKENDDDDDCRGLTTDTEQLSRSGKKKAPLPKSETQTELEQRRKEKLRKQALRKEKEEDKAAKESLISDNRQQRRQALVVELVERKYSFVEVMPFYPGNSSEEAPDSAANPLEDSAVAEKTVQGAGGTVETFMRNIVDPAYAFSDDENDGLKRRRPRKEDTAPEHSGEEAPGPENPEETLTQENLSSKDKLSPDRELFENDILEEAPATEDVPEEVEEELQDPKQPGLEEPEEREGLEGPEQHEEPEQIEELPETMPAETLEETGLVTTQEIPDSTTDSLAETHDLTAGSPVAAQDVSHLIILLDEAHQRDSTVTLPESEPTAEEPGLPELNVNLDPEPEPEPQPVPEQEREPLQGPDTELCPALHNSKPSTPQTPRRGAASKKAPGSQSHLSILSLVSDDSADEDELSLGPEDFTPDSLYRTLHVQMPTRRAPLQASRVSARRAYTARRITKSGDQGRPAAAAFSSPLLSRRRAGMAGMAGPEASSLFGSPVQTPRGSVRRCGQDGFKCGRDFCFQCL